MKSYDLIVIGSGAAGLTATYTALGFGKKVLVVEKDRPGGECTWSGCIPSKALINQAKEIYIARKYHDFIPDTANILADVRATSEQVYTEETPEVLMSAGADFVRGHAHFTDSHSIEVNGQCYQSRKFVIATGSSAAVPDFTGIDQISYLTNENIFQQTALPASLIVLGAGAIGMEISQALNRLGVTITVVEMMPEVMFREEAEFAALVRQRLQQEGVRFCLNSRLMSVQQSNGGIRLTVDSHGSQQTLAAAQLFIALGRSANISGMGLEKIGVQTDRGIKVNRHLQTNVKHIYACGDVTGPYLFSHMANYQGKIATMNAILPIKRSVDYRHVAWTTFTDPEFARAGLTETEARDKYQHIRVYHYDFNKLDRAKTKAGDFGKIKLITSSKGKLLGAHIISERAGELIAEIQILKTLGLNFSRLQKVIHPYPTYADSLRQLSQQVLLDNIFSHPLVRLFGRSKK